MTLEMKGIYKSFGANDVLRDVSTPAGADRERRTSAGDSPGR